MTVGYRIVPSAVVVREYAEPKAMNLNFKDIY